MVGAGSPVLGCVPPESRLGGRARFSRVHRPMRVGSRKVLSPIPTGYVQRTRLTHKSIRSAILYFPDDPGLLFRSRRHPYRHPTPVGVEGCRVPRPCRVSNVTLTVPCGGPGTGVPLSPFQSELSAGKVCTRGLSSDIHERGDFDSAGTSPNRNITFVTAQSYPRWTQGRKECSGR